MYSYSCGISYPSQSGVSGYTNSSRSLLMGRTDCASPMSKDTTSYPYFSSAQMLRTRNQGGYKRYSKSHNLPRVPLCIFERERDIEDYLD